MNKNIIKSIISADVPLLIWGPPGVGKTAFINSLAEESNVEIITLIGSTIDPSDLCGIPYIKDGELINSIPWWVKKIKKQLDSGGESWLFLDEFSCTAQTVQAAFLRIVNERFVADTDIGGCKIIAAANRADTAAFGGDLSPAAANRWAHVEWEISVEDWISGELSGWGKTRTKSHSQAAASVCSFIRKRPGTLLSIPKKIEEHSGPWPTPRAWSNAIKILANSNDIFSSVSSTVGSALAGEFYTYTQNLDLPSPEEILNKQKKMPTRGDLIVAVLDSIAAYVTSNGDESNVLKAWNILGSCREDIALSTAKILVNSFPHIITKEMQIFGEKIKSIK